MVSCHAQLGRDAYTNNNQSLSSAFRVYRVQASLARESYDCTLCLTRVSAVFGAGLAAGHAPRRSRGS